ncbi:hypothetical protein CTI12_AA209050 [Artemisia annua]|uniref:Uncharacterized protein n=1 Tax=Artemisia annua TaxID=35608 RepID=A0A2U1NZR8_ARTAN|nr:hypothetical protein CTI12_AA209050 [Artemisia annua]
MDFSPTAELECLLCHNFKSDPASLFDHQIECHKSPEHQAKSEELLLRFVASLARKDAEQVASELFKIDNATREKKLTAASARPDRKREKNGIKSVTTAAGTSAVTERENKARNGGRGAGTTGKGNNKKGWSRGRGRGDRGIQTRGGGNNSPHRRFEQVVDTDVADFVLKEESAIGEPIDSGVLEGKGNQVLQEDGDKLALKMAVENSLNLYGEGSSSGVELSEERASLIAKMQTLEVEGETSPDIAKFEILQSDYDEVEGEVILYKGKITKDSDEVEGEVILWKGRNFA